MNRLFYFLSGFFILSLLFLSRFSATAQNTDSARTAQKHYNDSLATARQQQQTAQKAYNDSVAAARKYILDSTRIAQKKYNDSVRAERDRVADSMAAIRSYLRSKQYNDSLELARKHRLDSIRLVQQRFNDSVRTERQRVADSVTAVRQKYNDSLKAVLAEQQAGRQRSLDSMKIIRQRTSDSLAAIREYRQSDQFKDSVAAVRKHALDSMKTVRKAYNDSMRTARKAILDSTVAVRKAYNDSLRSVLDSTRAVRQQYLDSMKVVRLARADSLAKVKEAREAARKEKTKETEKKKGLALELKIKKKQDAYTNEKMRKKKWGIPRQIIQNTFTRYNYYYNANRKMEEAEANMLRTATDNYDSLIAIFPFDPDRDSAKLKTDMDTIVRKASVGIQIHDPRSKWQDNLYLLAGQAFYYKGDYKNAAASFKYIVAQAEADKKEAAKKDKNKTDKKNLSTLAEEDKEGISGIIAHKSSKNEAMLWLSRTLTQDNKEGQAQALLDLLAHDPNFPERLKGQMALEQAFIDINRNDLSKATQSLSVVAEDKNMPDWVRQRTAFLNGQLLQKEGKYTDAEKYFNIAIDLHPALDMDFYARKNIVFNNLANNGDSTNVSDMLAVMAADDKYRPYYDQVYYAMGKADLKDNRSDRALENFRKSISFNQNNKKQKGLSYAALGDEYYKRNEYTSSKRAYDSAAMLLTAADEPVYSDAKQKSLSLDRIALPAREVQKQDSLLYLSTLSEKEQRNNARKYIRELERMMSDSAYLKQNTNTGFDNNMNGGSSGQWYFANATLMQQGANEFKMKWGSRTLKDNWNRTSGGASFGDEESDGMTDEERMLSVLPDEDSLVAAIPHTPEQILQANNKLKEAYYQLGKAYYSFVQDYAKANEAYDSLERRYPDNEHSAEVLYHRYLMAMKLNKNTEAQQYNATLQNKYKDSEWAILLKDALNAATDTSNPLLTNTGGPVETISNHYDKTYSLLMQRQFAEVIARTEGVEKLYPAQAAQYQKKYNLVKAVAIAGQGNYPKADTMLSQFLAINPNDSLTAWANSVLNYIRSNTPPVPPAKPANTDTLNNTTSGNSDTATKAYNYHPSEKHYMIIYSPMMDGRFMGLKSGLVDYNTLKHSEDNITVSSSALQPGKGIIVCQEFKNAALAKKYMNEVKGFRNLFREYGEQVEDYEISIISADNLSLLLAKKDYPAYRLFYQQKYK